MMVRLLLLSLVGYHLSNRQSSMPTKGDPLGRQHDRFHYPCWVTGRLWALLYGTMW